MYLLLLGGRTTTYLIRSYGIMFQVVTSMSIIFIPKLYSIWFSDNAVSEFHKAGGNNQTHIQPSRGSGTGTVSVHSPIQITKNVQTPLMSGHKLNTAVEMESPTPDQKYLVQTPGAMMQKE